MSYDIKKAAENVANGLGLYNGEDVDYILNALHIAFLEGERVQIKNNIERLNVKKEVEL